VRFPAALIQALPILTAAALLNRVSPAPAAQPVEACVVREVSREPLVVEGGRRLYVHPLVLETNSRGDALIAGELNYLFEPASSGWKRAAPDSVFGAVIPRSGRARIVPSPIPSRLLSGIRAIARDDDTWAVVFGETHPYAGAFRPDTITRLWFGIFDGTRWTSLERLPLPPAGTIRSQIMTRIVRYGDTLGFAMRIRSADQQRHVIVFEHGRAGWSYEIVQTQVGSYLALAHSDTLGLVLAAVQPDLTLRRDRNSLLLWNRGTTWKRLRTAAPSSSGDVHHPSMTISPGGAVMSWLVAVPGAGGVTFEARAMVGRPQERSEPVLRLDSSVAQFREPYSAVLRRDLRIWVLDHVEPETSGSEIRFIRDDGGSASVLGRLPNPFVTPWVGATPSDSTILLVGGRVNGQRETLVSLLVRAQLQCSPEAAR
jgi:hypothetical protein